MNVVKIVNTNTDKIQIYEATGRIKYSPTNNGKIDRRDGGTTEWWVVIDVNPEIGRYFRNLYHLHTYKTKSIQKPIWDAHVSIVRDEKPNNLDYWKKYDGKKIKYHFHHNPLSNDIYFWLPVDCQEALNLREELGLPRNPYFPLHLTIGNCKFD